MNRRYPHNLPPSLTAPNRFALPTEAMLEIRPSSNMRHSFEHRFVNSPAAIDPTTATAFKTMDNTTRTVFPADFVPPALLPYQYPLQRRESSTGTLDNHRQVSVNFPRPLGRRHNIPISGNPNLSAVTSLPLHPQLSRMIGDFPLGLLALQMQTSIPSLPLHQHQPVFHGIMPPSDRIPPFFPPPNNVDLLSTFNRPTTTACQSMNKNVIPIQNIIHTAGSHESRDATLGRNTPPLISTEGSTNNVNNHLKRCDYSHKIKQPIDSNRLTIGHNYEKQNSGLSLKAPFSNDQSNYRWSMGDSKNGDCSNCVSDISSDSETVDNCDNTDTPNKHEHSGGNDSHPSPSSILEECSQRSRKDYDYHTYNSNPHDENIVANATVNSGQTSPQNVDVLPMQQLSSNVPIPISSVPSKTSTREVHINNVNDNNILSNSYNDEINSECHNALLCEHKMPEQNCGEDDDCEGDHRESLHCGVVDVGPECSQGDESDIERKCIPTNRQEKEAQGNNNNNNN